MKTGTEANHKGLYSSECCDCEVIFETGQTLTRCPRCGALTVWEITDEPATRAA